MRLQGRRAGAGSGTDDEKEPPGARRRVARFWQAKSYLYPTIDCSKNAVSRYLGVRISVL
jgi:hypothetical protein